MPAFQYKAIDNKTGQVIKNTVNCITKQELYKILKENGLVPIDIQQVFGAKSRKHRIKMHRSSEEILRDLSPEQGRLIYNSNSIVKEENSKKNFKNCEHKITNRDIITFTQEFLLLKKADFNNIHALETIISATENIRFRPILEDILAGVESGEKLYTTMEYYSDIFPVIYINIIKAGELSDSLVTSLEQAIKYLETSCSLYKRIKKIIFSNVICFLEMLVLMIVGTIFTALTIQQVFNEIGLTEKMPWITQKFLELLMTLKYWWYYPVIIIAIVVIAIKIYIKTPKGKYQWNLFKYKAPIFGQLIYAIDFSNVMKLISLNLKSGMKIQQAIETSKNLTQNTIMQAILKESINNCLAGKSWIEPFEKSEFGNTMSTEMLKVGMQTDLPKMIDRLIELIESEIDAILQKIMKVLLKMSYLLFGVLLIFFICIAIIPCIQIYMGEFTF